MRALGFKGDDTTVNALFTAFDADGDGTMEIEEVLP